ncbi:MAG: DUF2851 family protein [Bacteroidota bacterium]|nr:DUF2851 family protein [Bacteroidota bacterium]MDP4232050.1 DUF2851 family protein [Bacteroidota bacterium]MDP4241243.1 DUF2851 family protein [Bacteroidota bacterium]MDP4286635.1 DUF2851 family protein [Bacteroidota bacterium]
MIPEYLQREIWKDHEAFLVRPLVLADGSPLSILEIGRENEHRGGPDFLGARIAIDSLAIAGDVELHTNASGWHEHKHHTDARYSNVVLHVVLNGEELEAGPPVPTLVLASNLALDQTALWDALFRKMYDRSPELPCFPHNLIVPMRYKRKVIESFGEARLDELIDRVALQDSEIISTSTILERVYQLTMDALGYSQNRIPFRELSALVPLQHLQFVRANSLPQLRLTYEALFFGAAGLLAKPSEAFDAEANEYLLDLQSRWHTLQVVLSLPETLAENDWAFFRIRPANSPRRRLALAALLAEKYFGRPEWDFRDDFFAGGPTVTLGDSPFWERRSSFATPPLTEAQSLLGEERSSGIWLNVVLPARIAQARSQKGASRQSASSTATSPSEKWLRNQWGESRTRSSAEYLNVIRQELLEGEGVVNVRSEQGALLLKRNFCDTARCSECPVGHRLSEKGWNKGKISRE